MTRLRTTLQHCALALLVGCASPLTVQEPTPERTPTIIPAQQPSFPEELVPPTPLFPRTKLLSISPEDYLRSVDGVAQDFRYVGIQGLTSMRYIDYNQQPPRRVNGVNNPHSDFLRRIPEGTAVIVGYRLLPFMGTYFLESGTAMVPIKREPKRISTAIE